MKEITKDLLLENSVISTMTESLDDLLQTFDVNEQDLIRLKLSVEQVLLNFQERFGKEKKARVTVRSRFNRASLSVSVIGEPYNPILADQSDDEENIDPIPQGILYNIGLSPEYQYKHNQNLVLFPLPGKEINSAWFLVLALVAALVLGIGGNHLGQGFRDSVGTVLTMFYDILFGLISMFAAPMVFFTMIIGICDIGDIGQLKAFGKKVMKGFFSPYLWGIVICVALPFLFHLNFGGSSASGSALASITEAITGIFPSDFVTPFANGDFAQIVVAAILLGIGTLILAQEVPAVLAFLTQVNRIISMILNYLCMLIPVIIFVTVVQIIWSGEIAVILSAWMPVLFIVIWLVLVMLLEMTHTGKVLGEKAGMILKKCFPLIITGMSTASISACYSNMDKTAVEDLSADRKTAGFAIPIGMMAFGSAEFVEFLTLSVYFASVAGIDVTASWLILAVILSFIFSVALPPVAGGPVVVLSIMLALLNVPTTYIGLAGAVALLIDYPCTAVRSTGVVLVTARISKQQREKNG